MTTERSAAIAAALALAALGWGALYRPMVAGTMVAGDDESADRQVQRRYFRTPATPAAPPQRLSAGSPRPESDRDRTPNLAHFVQRGSHPEPDSAMKIVYDVKQQDGTSRSSATKKRTTRSPKHAPGKLPQPKHAFPVFPESKRTGTLRSVIKEELPEATPQQIRIWERVLRDVPLNKARHMLQLRRLVPLHGGPPDSGRKTPEAQRRTPQVQRLPLPQPPLSNAKRDAPAVVMPPAPEGVLRSAVPAQWQRSLNALKRARDVILNNIANAHTPGFKRARVLFGTRPPVRKWASGAGDAGPLFSVGSGVRIAAIRRDWTNGRLMPTGRPLDLAIHGPGFFVLHDGRRKVYARCGHFTLDANARIVLAGTHGRCVLDVSRRRSAGGLFNLFSGGTLCSLRWSWSLAFAFEHIRLAVFPNPDALKPLGNSVFAETEASGSPRLVVAGDSNSSVLKQGYLERSNVDIEREMEQLRKIAQQREAILQALAAWTQTRMTNDEWRMTDD